MYIAQQPKLCVAPAVIRFLGFNPAKVKSEFTKESSGSLFDAEEDVPVGEEAGEEEDLFGVADAAAEDFELLQDLDELAGQEGVRAATDILSISPITTAKPQWPSRRIRNAEPTVCVLLDEFPCDVAY